MATGRTTREPSLFGSLLLRYRVAAGLTQEELAARAGISPDAVATLERGTRRSPRASTIRLLADALGLGDAERVEWRAAARPLPTRTVTTNGAADSQMAQPPRHIAAQPSPLIGRADELGTILRWLTVDGVRLLTLVGPAGVGKTRLALATVAAISSRASDHFPDGVVWVDLTSVRDPQDVLGTIGRAFSFADAGSPPLSERLPVYLQDRALLLVLDNFEQLLPAAAATLANLLGACTRLAMLVTSRVPLQLRWEHSLRIMPLPVPDLSVTLPPVDALATVPSVELFVARARTHRADFALTPARAPLVAQLAVQLDGLPLALELAAARLDVLSLPTLVRRLGDRLRLLASEAPDLPERQRSLAAAVGWSYDLLSEPERRLFRCLGVFVGRVTLEAVTIVARVIGAAARDGEAREASQATDDGRTLQRLISLAEKSLILPAQSEEPDGWRGHSGEAEELEGDEPEPAFGMLETVRECAWAQLADEGELEAARRAHARYFLALAERAEPELRGHNQRAWYFRLEHEQDNLRAALHWLLDQDGPDAAERHAGLRLAGALGWFWRLRGYHEEGWRWLEEALARAPQAEGADLAARTHVLVAAVALLAVRGDLARARALAEEGLALAQQQQDDAAAAAVLMHLGLGGVIAGEVEEGTRWLHRAMRRWEALSDPLGLGETQLYLGYAAHMAGDVAAAASHYADAVSRLGGRNAQLAGFAHCYLGVIEWKRGHLREALEEVQVGLQSSVALRDRWLLSFGALAALTVLGDYAEPTRWARLVGATDALRQAAGNTYSTYSWEHLPATRDAVELRQRLAREGWDAAYREGRSLPIGEVAALALSLLADVANAPSRGVAAS